MAAIIVELKCITNMHVGNGDVNYNIVDNEVELDPVTEYPTINSSGVKGALRSHFKNDAHALAWFGSDPNVKTNHQQGKLKILNANMLMRPLRATDDLAPYHLVYTDKMFEQYTEMCSIFGIQPAYTKASNNNSVSVEGIPVSDPITGNGETAYKCNLLKDYALPVIARNHLDNGISTNLWYEEVVPHQSMFYFFVLSEDQSLLDDFKNAINNAKVIQFGGNATIGYGLCKVSAR